MTTFEYLIHMTFIAVISIAIGTFGSLDVPSITADEHLIPDDPYVITNYSYATREDYVI